MRRFARNGFVAALAVLAIVGGPVAPAGADTPTITYVALDERQEQESGDDDHGMWGLLGLLGLVGLVGLVRRGRSADRLAGPAAEPLPTRYGDK